MGTWLRGCACVAAFSAAALGACYLSSSSDPQPDASADDAGPETAVCVRQLPDCPDAGPPSYEGRIQGIIEAGCVACHYPGNPLSPFVLSTYPDLYKNRGSALDQVYACLMPPADAAALTPDARADLLTWLVCGSPDN